MGADDFFSILPEILMMVFTGFVALFTYRVYQATQLMAKLNTRLNWFTGSMESHSQLSLMLEAQKEGIPVIWWDPSEESWPITGPHKSEIKIERLRIGMHPRDRKVKPLTWQG